VRDGIELAELKQYHRMENHIIICNNVQEGSKVLVYVRHELAN